MSASKTVAKVRKRTASIRFKLTMSLLSIVVILLVSSIIAVMEYSRMSSYVSELIADDISSINVAVKLSDMANDYNLGILTVIGDDKISTRPDFDDSYFKSNCGNLASSTDNVISPLADSVMYSYAAYMLTSLELEDVLKSDFVDSRTWYFERLQPRFNRLRDDVDALSAAIHADLQENSSTFERGFYRSIIPGIVAVDVGILLVFLLLFYMISYYVNPLYRMLDSLKGYLAFDRKYTNEFDGDDQLAELNRDISELTNENRELRTRIAALKSKSSNGLESNQP